MFGEFNEATQPKTSLAKYSIEFNDLAVQSHPHQIPFLRLLGRPNRLLYVSRFVGRLVKSLKGNGKKRTGRQLTAGWGGSEGIK